MKERLRLGEERLLWDEGISFCLMGWLLATLACLPAQAGNGASLLIRDVRLIDRDDRGRSDGANVRLVLMLE